MSELTKAQKNKTLKVINDLIQKNEDIILDVQEIQPLWVSNVQTNLDILTSFKGLLDNDLPLVIDVQESLSESTLMFLDNVMEVVLPFEFKVENKIIKMLIK